ncbi:P-loop containing nucleoside triphosphate hydrolase protein [Cristinia sonorae]|uniref:P-loop containing nucleoside triphosphate hydrolase protein n=1 Tax=Cristinia sonorae TaxID=1940300 RepID=A0A8K0UF18_9AGAR|nr:P-loop containing nucleoside triphosphate hydrolase protein [Cristinia sonorae]
MNTQSVVCPICSKHIPEDAINSHLDNNCSDAGSSGAPSYKTLKPSKAKSKEAHAPVAPIFAKKEMKEHIPSSPVAGPSHSQSPALNKKRKADVFSLSTTSTKRLKDLSASAPLAERLRPKSLKDFVGHQSVIGPDSLLTSMIKAGSTGSMILWGPPGCGKTTLARLMARNTDAVFKELSATDSNISDVRAVAEEAKGVLSLSRRRTILFLDEVHRFNKAQQDIFLPFVEQGIIQLIGATTENPSFKLTNALLSRCRVFVLERLTDEDIKAIVVRAARRVASESPPEAPPQSKIMDLTGSSTAPPSSSLNNSQPQPPEPDVTQLYPQCTSEVLSSIVSLSTGDARTALSLLELVIAAPHDSDPEKILKSLRQSVSTSYDRSGDSRYDMISALHKSVRGSQASAALYWLARMLSAGEDPMYIARRMAVCASEDIGLADNHALPLAVATMQACQMIGMPECRINLAHLVSYLSEAPKSTRSYEGYKRAEEAAALDTTIPVPMMVRNAPTPLMSELGYSKGYCYNPDYAHPVTNDYLPIQFRGDVFLRKEGDMTGKTWDEAALLRWEAEENGGRPWPGRGQPNCTRP